MNNDTTTPTNSSENRWNRGNSADRKRRKGNHIRHSGNGIDRAYCCWCGRELFDRGPAASGGGYDDHMTEEHIIPHSKGGRYVMTNLLPACELHNKMRGDRDFLEFAEEMGVDGPALIRHAQSYRKLGRKKA